MSKVMAPEHPLWDEFRERLEGPEGCNFQGEDDEEGKLIVDTVTWKCAGGKDKSLATAILETISDVDIPASLAFFEEHGGHCDCEILFNVAQ